MCQVHNLVPTWRIHTMMLNSNLRTVPLSMMHKLWYAAGFCWQFPCLSTPDISRDVLLWLLSHTDKTKHIMITLTKHETDIFDKWCIIKNNAAILCPSLSLSMSVWTANLVLNAVCGVLSFYRMAAWQGIHSLIKFFSIPTALCKILKVLNASHVFVDYVMYFFLQANNPSGCFVHYPATFCKRHLNWTLNKPQLLKGQ